MWTLKTLCAIALASLIPLIAVADDGDPDPAFSGDGLALATWSPAYTYVDTSAVTALSDGSIATAGWVYQSAQNFDFAIAKFRPDGSADDGFGVGGKVVVPIDVEPGENDRAIGVFDAGGGKLLVVGSAGLGAQPYEYLALLRLNANGSLDTTFANGSALRLVTNQSLGADASFNFDVAVQQPDGKIIIAGSCNTCGNGTPTDFMAVRVLPTGVVDVTFGNAGWVHFGLADDTDRYREEHVRAVAVDTHGNVVLVGTSKLNDDPTDREQPFIVRYTPTGELDTDFAGSGYLDVNIIGSWSADAAAIDPYNDSIVVAINTSHMPNVVPAAFLIRVNRDGVLSNSFGENGIVDLTIADGTHIDALTVLHNHRRIVAAGWVDPSSADPFDFYVARLNTSGSFDSTFDDNGYNVIPFDAPENSQDKPRAMTLSAGRPVIAGVIISPNFAEYSTGVLRLQSDWIFGSRFELGE